MLRPWSTGRILGTQVGDKIGLEENPAPAQLRSRYFPGLSLGSQGLPVHQQEGRSGLQIEGFMLNSLHRCASCIRLPRPCRQGGCPHPEGHFLQCCRPCVSPEPWQRHSF